MRKSKSSSDAEHIIPDLKPAEGMTPIIAPQKPDFKHSSERLGDRTFSLFLKTEYPPGTRFEDAYREAHGRARFTIDLDNELGAAEEHEWIVNEERRASDLEKYGREIPDLMDLDEAIIFITATPKPNEKAKKSRVAAALAKLHRQGWRMVVDKVQTREGAYQLVPAIVHPGERLVFHYVHGETLLRHQVIEFRGHYLAIQEQRRSRRQKKNALTDKSSFRKAG